ncbi:MAG: DUF1501 domain-containing protein [Opitutae bacterium]|nr:DUF1501 domain-containing protein [Opitutae bacterium]MBT4666270.1 DUF1501 domain-containing protein [Opitutae bacterium]MBT5909956.1 DUF1501 domain-containing protein [Opitutae bacterium]MBT6851718.1 DUF1501 domain-containing protein [Opitutae bacterium]MBT7741701.1 DUF1501 domain-containing protein [Opitutae bacterium]
MSRVRCRCRFFPQGIIHLHLDGGPPHTGLIAPKPDVPAEIRGSFAPIPIKLAGLQVSELLPKVAGIADRLVPHKGVLNSARPSI